jgi:hypothetical protein
MPIMLQGFIVFISLFALNVIWARYTIEVTNGSRWKAGACASAITVLSGYAAISYVSNPWMLLPAMAGAFLGTGIGAQ